MIDKLVALVKSQITFHEYVQSKHAKDTPQYLKQVDLQNSYSELMDDLLLIQKSAQKYGVPTIKELLDVLDKPAQNIISSDLTPADLDGLPPEILAKLEISESDKYEFEIINIINSLGGTASIRKIMVEIYKRTGDMPDKTTLNNKLYRMTKGSLYKSSAGKGFYSTSDDGSSQNSDIDDLL
jgi:hypothetical protein